MWSKAEVKKLEKLYHSKPAWMTNYELSGQVARRFGKSPEAIRWQLRQFYREPTVTFPKILILDIETLPIDAYVWGVWNQNIGTHQIKKDWSIVCYSAKWLFGTEFYGEHVTPKEAKHRSSESILGGIWELLNKADMVVTQNGDEFDIKRLNTEFLKAGMPPPHHFVSVDTYKVLKQNFAFTYNKLDWVAQVLGIGRKVQTQFKWWDECAKGNLEYLEKMSKYNKFDVALTEELYLILRPWVKSNLNMNLFSEKGVSICPNCGDPDLEWNGTYATPKGLYKAFRCQHCGSIGRSTSKEYKLRKSQV